MQTLAILGGGFAGVWAAMSAAARREALGAQNVAISLVSRDPWLTIRPRLYEGATEEMRVPLAPLMKEIGVRLSVAEAREIDVARGRIGLANEERLAFDRLVLATGSQLLPPKIPGADRHSYSVDTFAEATRLDMHLAALRGDATLVVIGASFTGLEVATELRGRMGETARIVLIDRARLADAAMGAGLQPYIAEALAACRVETRFGAEVSEIRADGVVLNDGERIGTRTVILATGLKANPLVHQVPGDRDPHDRLMVDADLKVTGLSNIFAAGDTAHAVADGAHATYMSCQHAIQLGRFAGHNALCDLLGLPTLRYRQERYVTCLDLGPWGAVFSSGWDRQVAKIREDAKSMKRRINREWIYPPRPEIGKAAIFARLASETP